MFCGSETLAAATASSRFSTKAHSVTCASLTLNATMESRRQRKPAASPDSVLALSDYHVFAVLDQVLEMQCPLVDGPDNVNCPASRSVLRTHVRATLVRLQFAGRSQTLRKPRASGPPSPPDPLAPGSPCAMRRSPQHAGAIPRVATFISHALARGLTVFETARIAGTSVAMIEAHYGALLGTAHDSLLERVDVTGEVAK